MLVLLKVNYIKEFGLCVEVIGPEPSTEGPGSEGG